jgi:soluble lytic murein transglycosylase
LAESTAAYRAIAELYPTSTMADDGLTRAGISLAEAGDLAGAMKLWTEALERVPNGDTVPEATFRLAFSHYQQGDPAAAVAVAERLGTLDPLVDAWSVLGGQYWAARWMLYPEVGDPREPVPSGRAEALAGWKALVKAQPQTYYGQLAWSRLKEEDPAAAEALAVRPPPDAGFGPWSVRASFFRNRAVADGVALARLGLVQEAMEEWGTADLFKAQPEEVAWLQELRTVQGDWLSAHKWIQQYMRVKAVGAMGPRSAQIVSVAFPDRYWTDVKAVASGYSYPPRVFHALVREESSFDKDIKSFAGARGLSQVMPATAQEVAGWLGRSVRTDDLYDARLNLTLGSRYLESCFKTHKGNPYLAMASYNGGPARMSGYVRDWGNPPTDEYVERIPIRESREYIKKVATSWQIMRFGFDVEDTPFPDLSAYNHYAWPQ